jgi:hypothetical protein
MMAIFLQSRVFHQSDKNESPLDTISVGFRYHRLRTRWSRSKFWFSDCSSGLLLSLTDDSRLLSVCGMTQNVLIYCFLIMPAMQTLSNVYLFTWRGSRVLLMRLLRKIRRFRTFTSLDRNLDSVQTNFIPDGISSLFQ